MESKLLPCPFCGKTETLECVNDFELGYIPRGDATGYYCIICDHCHSGCGAAGGFMESADEAIEAWNSRAAMGWISAKDRLPEIEGNRIPSSIGCLVVAMEGSKPTVTYMEYEKAMVRKKVVFRWIWMNRISSWEVTHWMPLPEPPKSL